MDQLGVEDTATPSAENAVGSLTADELVRRHAGAVQALCLARTGSIHDAEDVMQETFIKAIGRLDTLRDAGKARAWLLQIARRLCVDFYRRRHRVTFITADVPAPIRECDPRIERLYKAVAKLPENYRETILLYYLDGRSCASVAACLDITETAVRQRLVRGRAMLFELLTEEEL